MKKYNPIYIFIFIFKLNQITSIGRRMMSVAIVLVTTLIIVFGFISSHINFNLPSINFFSSLFQGFLNSLFTRKFYMSESSTLGKNKYFINKNCSLFHLKVQFCNLKYLRMKKKTL